MTRDDLRGSVEGISDEQLKKILDINSLDIGKAKRGAEELKTELEGNAAKIAEMEKELETLRLGQCEAEEIKKRAEELQKIIDDRREQDEKEAKTADLESRFAAVVGDAKFLNGYTRKGIFDSFCEAIQNAENQGRADGEIFKEITGDAENLFAKAVDTPAVVASTMGFDGELSRGDIREIMGLPTER